MYSRVPSWITAVLIAALTAAVFANGASAPFVFDDIPELVQNLDIRSFSGCLDTISRSSDTGLAGRPAACITFALNYALGGLDVRGFHLVNILIHVLAALTLFGLLRRTLERSPTDFKACLKSPLPLGGEGWVRGKTCDRLRVRPAPLHSPFQGEGVPKHALSAHPSALALCIAVLWSIHPLQTESVTYVIQRIESLAGLWYLLTLYCAARIFTGTTVWTWRGCAMACCAMGMLTKEIVATAPIVVFLYDVCFWTGSFGRALRRNRLLYAGLAATWLIPAILLSQSPRGGSVGFGLGVSPLDYLRTQAGVILYYLHLCVWPNPLAISYSDWPIVREWRNAAAPGIIIIALLTVSTIGAARRRSWGFAGAFFFIVLSCSSSFIPIVTEPAAERRMYLPLAAIVGLVVVLADRAISRLLRLVDARPRTHRVVKAVSCLVVVGPLVVGTVMRNADYASVGGLLSKTLTVRPGDELVRGALIEELIQQRRFADADRVQAEGLALNRASYILYDNWGRSMMSVGRFDDAVAGFQKALEIRPSDYRSLSGMGAAFAGQGHWPEAVEQLRAAIRLQPDAYTAHGNLGVALANCGENEEAIAEFREAVRLKPGYVEGRFNLGRLLMNRGETREAIIHLSAASRSAPADIEIMLALGEALEKDGRRDDAIRQYQAVLARQADNASALSQLRILRAEHD